MPRLLLTAAIGLAAAVALPSMAEGATLHQDGRASKRVLFQADPGETNLVSVEGSKHVVIRDLNAPIKVAGVPGCMPIDERAVRCSSLRQLELDLGDAPDHASIYTTIPVELEGGPGRDRYNSLTTGGPSRVDFDGGIGLDSVSYFYADTGVNVSVDLEAGDGRPGDDDQIRRDVESVIGSTFDDVLTGSPYTLELHGVDGNDRITGGAGAELLSGGPGSDRIEARDGAADAVDCGGQALDWAAVDLVEASITGCAEIAG